MHGRAAIVEALRGIERYDRTTHFIGNQLARVEGDTATAETYCLAHHIHERDGGVVDFMFPAAGGISRSPALQIGFPGQRVSGSDGEAPSPASSAGS